MWINIVDFAHVSCESGMIKDASWISSRLLYVLFGRATMGRAVPQAVLEFRSQALNGLAASWSVTSRAQPKITMF